MNESIQQPAERVLIANRGEIAFRAVQACRALGYESIAVYSTADRGAPHAQLADESICIGPPAARDSYLKKETLLHIAKQRNCTMLYPGYGFLAENAVFAASCESAGVTFVGPSADCIRTMGDKAAARDAARDLGVPVVEGSDGVVTDSAMAMEVARSIGFPLLVKASAGGGGRGMRVVESDATLTAMIEQASEEAREAFGDPAVYLERYFPRVRHIEVQVFGDSTGEVRELGERDCTTQRRHQKLVEEGPSPVLNDEERSALLSAAMKLARGVNYIGAGTVEFIFDEQSRGFFFIEMNTRIQVEHPVTEMRIGHDLIIEQLTVASGRPLSIPPREEWPGGHVFEFRINAEDPQNNFMPSPGRITEWQPPSGQGVRLDTFASKGMVVQPFYDSMVAKLLVQGADRAEALARSRTALADFRVGGIHTTIPFHNTLVNDSDFIENRIHTRWVEESFSGINTTAPDT